ncbi:sulfiredoxin, chloroplastic/mitochondrial isoform X1 [Amborella trichopoda]|uniref:sulfiredoxin, chloroplastic/mitochondrial isoform X1 n=1 Tax=Amborella trichopoda TaxID=13333 RepID=UPI0009C0A204|nr:sulfiredoxin, chloroplastic/mitochondrial isoform X1 [Amborella trichopoda]|eukprot:XP_020531507.1 sulfiredoxin, chloroplastic/mitochondrial isoform X1 [Amborella trichopoda]
MAYLSLQLSLQLAPKTNFSLRAINYTQNGAPYQNTKSGGPLILEIPLEKIRRPLSRTRANDPVKVKDLMESIQEIGLQEPKKKRDNEDAYMKIVFWKKKMHRLYGLCSLWPLVLKSITKTWKLMSICMCFLLVGTIVS